MVTDSNVLGMVLLGLSVWLFRAGIRYRDDSESGFVTNIQLIGSSLLLLIIAIGFLTSTKTICEILGVLC